jgi:hypothetical protein
VKGHLDYAKKLALVLDAVGIKTTPLSQASHQDMQILESEQNIIAGAEKEGKLDSEMVLQDEMNSISVSTEFYLNSHMSQPGIPENSTEHPLQDNTVENSNCDQ